MGFCSVQNPIFRNNPANFHSNSDNFCYKTFRYETVNIHLRSKPEWFAKDINPLGKVPTLQIDDKIVYDSQICNEYIDEVYPGDESASRDPYQRAKDGMLLEHFPKVFFVQGCDNLVCAGNKNKIGNKKNVYILI